MRWPFDMTSALNENLLLVCKTSRSSYRRGIIHPQYPPRPTCAREKNGCRYRGSATAINKVPTTRIVTNAPIVAGLGFEFRDRRRRRFRWESRLLCDITVFPFHSKTILHNLKITPNRYTHMNLKSKGNSWFLYEKMCRTRQRIRHI
jgi:hypothetical protein